MVRHAVSGTGQKKSSWYQCSCCLRSTAGNIRNIVKSHVLDSKSIQLKDISSDDVSFKTYPLCLPLTLLHVVQMRWLDHFLIQTSPSSQHNSPLLGITSAVYIFPPMLMEIWRGPRLSWSNFQNQYQPPQKKTEPPKNSKDSKDFWNKKKPYYHSGERVFSFSRLGIRQSQQGKIWPSPRSSTDPRPPSSLQPPKVRKDPNENLEPRWERWTEGVPRSSEAKAGQLGWGGF